VFIKYEAKVSSRVSGGQGGVVDFGKLFTETNEQKFRNSEIQSFNGSDCKAVCATDCGRARQRMKVSSATSSRLVDQITTGSNFYLRCEI